jgi:iron complex outermembrane receptor protein
MVPGVQVAKIDSNKWAVSSRGFNGRFSNRLLVLMDGRSLYTPYFMGVYWEIQDTILEDIDRIEVIRGPGAALWGANAVNGVINIITKSAESTRSTLLTAGGGTYEKGFAAARVGASLSDSTNVRLYAKHNQRDSFQLESGGNSNDQWHTTQGGFRLDSQPNIHDTLALQGDYYDGRLNETFILYDSPANSAAVPGYKHIDAAGNHVNGGNILTRWQHTISETNNLSLQAYYDHSEYGMLLSPQKSNTVDLDFQQRFSAGSIHDFVYGFGYRYNLYEITNHPTLSFNTTSVTNNLFSTYIHDEISIVPSKIALIVGSRFEYNDNSGFSYQPNGRLLWTITPHNSIWGSVSRAVRSTTKGEQEINYNYRTTPQTGVNGLGLDPSKPLKLEINGNPDFKSEELLAYEIGYRSEVTSNISIDLAFYYNQYKNLRVITPYNAVSAGTPPNDYNLLQYKLSNDMHGNALGVEVAADWTPLDWWRLQLAYSYQNLQMNLDGNSKDVINKGNAEGDTPQHQVSLRSGFDFGKTVTLDLWLRGTDRLASIDGISIPGYFTMDVRMAWKPIKCLELSVVGQNLFQNRHPEFIPEYINTLPSDVVRSAYGKATFKF